MPQPTVRELKLTQPQVDAVAQLIGNALEGIRVEPEDEEGDSWIEYPPGAKLPSEQTALRDVLHELIKPIPRDPEITLTKAA